MNTHPGYETITEVFCLYPGLTCQVSGKEATGRTALDALVNAQKIRKVVDGNRELFYLADVEALMVINAEERLVGPPAVCHRCTYCEEKNVRGVSLSCCSKLGLEDIDLLAPACKHFSRR